MDDRPVPERIRRWLACWRTLTVRRVTLRHIGCGVYQALRQRDRVFEQMYHRDRWSAEAMVESWIRSGETREPALAARGGEVQG